MSTEATIIDSDEQDWFINRDQLTGEVFLYTKDSEIAINDGTHCVYLSPEVIKAIGTLGEQEKGPITFDLEDGE